MYIYEQDIKDIHKKINQIKENLMLYYNATMAKEGKDDVHNSITTTSPDENKMNSLEHLKESKKHLQQSYIHLLNAANNTVEDENNWELHEKKMILEKAQSILKILGESTFNKI